MSRSARCIRDLAPLRRVMIRDSLAAQEAGYHVEQVEMVFNAGTWKARVPAAWDEIVAKTEALQIAFLTDRGVLEGTEIVTPPAISVETGSSPEAWESWLTMDRHRPLLTPHQVPWRAIYWPHDGRFLWTVHHAVLDGRSLTAVLRNFLTRLAGGPAENLKLSEWHPPTQQAIQTANRMFRDGFPPTPQFLSLAEESRADPAVRFLGVDFRGRLEQFAAGLEITVATILIWAWGQALAESAGKDFAIVEQVRSGAPQSGTAGFLMHTLPLVIPRRRDRPSSGCLQDFRTQLLNLRAIEGVSPEDFPPGVFPFLDHIDGSVIMVEHGTLHHLIGGGEMVGSLRLYENKSESLMVTAHILPDLRLEVEGRGRHGLLEAWIRVLDGLVNS